MTDISSINKLERGRAELAYNCVLEAREKFKGEEKEKLLKEYRSYARKIPTMILTNGLGQTLAFIKAKSKGSDENGEGKGEAYELLYLQITEYMKSESVARISMPPDKGELVEWVISCSSTEYRYITQEIMAFMMWLARFAEGMIDK